MTTNELRELLDKEGYPQRYEVDHETYANVCQSIFTYHMNNSPNIIIQYQDYNEIGISIGHYRDGIMFKNVELILKDGRE